MKPVFLLDSYGVIFRSYYAFFSRPLMSPEGENVSAVFGFFMNLFQLWDKFHPEAFAAVFDSKVPTFRHEEYVEYKANRQKTPEDLHAQVPIVEEILHALGIPVISANRYEADDIIATIAKRCKDENRPCYVISSDKDLLQLVGGSVLALKPDKNLGFVCMGEPEVEAEWGVRPERILDYLSLIGDSADNIPGVPGVGDKTALKLLSQYDSFDEIYKNIESIKPDSLKKKLENGREIAHLSKKLITLAYDAPISLKNLDELSVAELNREKASPLFLKYGMKTLARKGSSKASLETKDNQETKVQTEEKTDFLTKTEKNYDVPQSYSKQGKSSAILEIEELQNIVNKAIEQKVFAFDCETDSLDEMNALPVGFSIAIDPLEAFYIPLNNSDSLWGSHQNTQCIKNELVKKELNKLFSNTDITLVGQNVKFDMHIMENYGVQMKCKIWDTMIASWLCNPERDSLKLENLGQAYLGFSGIPYLEVAPKGTCFSEVALEKAVPYAAEDAYMVLRLKEILSKELKDKKLESLFSDIEMPVLSILSKMERNGIMVEKNSLVEYGKELDSEIEKTQKETYLQAGHEFNMNSPKQLQEVLFVERKLSTGKKTKTGYSTDVSVLEELAKEDPVPELILKHRTLQKLKSTYVDSLVELLKNDDRLHTHYIQTGTATGRLSSRDPNLQNIPVREESGRRIRKAFVAKKGFTLISADYTQIELVVFAHLSKDKELCEAFLQNKDIHKRTASLIFGKNEDEISASERRTAKTINFGVIYGMSAFRLAKELDISRKEAQNFIDAYFNQYKGVDKFIKEIVDSTSKEGLVKTVLGRTRFVPTINSRNANERQAAERIAVNTPIQGSAADIVKIAMIKVDDLLKKYPSANLLLQVHDEFIIEAPDEMATEIANEVEKVMMDAYKLSVPLRVGVEKAKHWGDMH